MCCPYLLTDLASVLFLERITSGIHCVALMRKPRQIKHPRSKGGHWYPRSKIGHWYGSVDGGGCQVDKHDSTADGEIVAWVE